MVQLGPTGGLLRYNLTDALFCSGFCECNLRAKRNPASGVL